MPYKLVLSCNIVQEKSLRNLIIAFGWSLRPSYKLNMLDLSKFKRPVELTYSVVIPRRDGFLSRPKDHVWSKWATGTVVRLDTGSFIIT